MGRLGAREDNERRKGFLQRGGEVCPEGTMINFALAVIVVDRRRDRASGGRRGGHRLAAASHIQQEEQMTREELKRRIEIADQVLRETRYSPWHFRSYLWLEDERARLVRELKALTQQEAVS